MSHIWGCSGVAGGSCPATQGPGRCHRRWSGSDSGTQCARSELPPSLRTHYQVRTRSTDFTSAGSAAAEQVGTMVADQDDVDAAVQVHLLESVQQLTDESVDTPQRTVELEHIHVQVQSTTTVLHLYKHTLTSVLIGPNLCPYVSGCSKCTANTYGLEPPETEAVRTDRTSDSIPITNSISAS